MVLHVDGKTIVIAKGLIKANIFNGEYKFEGLTWGIEIPVVQTPPCNLKKTA